MSSTLKYIIDDSGHKTSVLVPVKTWQELNANYAKLLKKLEVLTGIQQAMKEVGEAKRKGKKLETLKDFLRERNG